MTMTTRTAAVEWYESEWDVFINGAFVTGFSAELNGILADIEPKSDGTFYWKVRPSSSRVEYPELFNSGPAATADEAKSQAEEALECADKAYPEIIYDQRSESEEGYGWKPMMGSMSVAQKTAIRREARQFLAKARSRDPSWWDAEGNYYPGDLDWVSIPWFDSSADCEHGETMCPECIDSWDADWEIQGATDEDLTPDVVEEDGRRVAMIRRASPETLQPGQAYAARFCCNCGVGHAMQLAACTVVDVQGDRATINANFNGVSPETFEIYQFDNEDAWGTYWAYGSDADPIDFGEHTTLPDIMNSDEESEEEDGWGGSAHWSSRVASFWVDDTMGNAYGPYPSVEDAEAGATNLKNFGAIGSYSIRNDEDEPQWQPPTPDSSPMNGLASRGDKMARSYGTCPDCGSALDRQDDDIICPNCPYNKTSGHRRRASENTCYNCGKDIEKDGGLWVHSGSGNAECSMADPDDPSPDKAEPKEHEARRHRAAARECPECGVDLDSNDGDPEHDPSCPHYGKNYSGSRHAMDTDGDGQDDDPEQQQKEDGGGGLLDEVAEMDPTGVVKGLTGLLGETRPVFQCICRRAATVFAYPTGHREAGGFRCDQCVNRATRTGTKLTFEPLGNRLWTRAFTIARLAADEEGDTEAQVEQEDVAGIAQWLLDNPDQVVEGGDDEGDDPGDGSDEGDETSEDDDSDSDDDESGDDDGGDEEDGPDESGGEDSGDEGSVDSSSDKDESKDEAPEEESKDVDKHTESESSSESEGSDDDSKEAHRLTEGFHQVAYRPVAAVELDDNSTFTDESDAGAESGTPGPPAEPGSSNVPPADVVGGFPSDKDPTAAEGDFPSDKDPTAEAGDFPDDKTPTAEGPPKNARVPKSAERYLDDDVVVFL